MRYRLRTLMIVLACLLCCLVQVSCNRVAPQGIEKLISDEWKKDRDELPRIAKELVRAEIVAYVPGKNGYERVGPIVLSSGSDLDRLRDLLLGATDFGPNTHEQYATEDEVDITLVYDGNYQRLASVMDRTIWCFTDLNNRAVGTLPYEFIPFIDNLVRNHAREHPENIVNRVRKQQSR